jgi:hypothetical protein
MGISGGVSALQRYKVFCLPQKPVYHPVHLAAFSRWLAQLKNELDIPCRGSEYFFTLSMRSGNSYLRCGEVWNDRGIMLQRR